MSKDSDQFDFVNLRDMDKSTQEVDPDSLAKAKTAVDKKAREELGKEIGQLTGTEVDQLLDLDEADLNDDRGTRQIDVRDLRKGDT